MRWIVLFVGLLLYQLPYARTLNVALSAFAAPFVMKVSANNQYSGFAVDIMQAICQRMNSECRYQGMNFYKMFSVITNDEYDLGTGAIIITPEREKVVLFSMPFLKSNVQFITRTDSKVNTIEGFRGKKFGVITKGLSIDVLQKMFGNDVDYVEYDNTSPLILALSNGEVDAAVTDSVIVELWQANNSSIFKLIGKPIPVGMGYGIMAAKTNVKLISAVNEALLSMEKDGSYLKIYRTYFSD